jgi:hypothetical protein
MIAKKDTIEQSTRDEWFEKFVAYLSADKFMLDTDTASVELKTLYGDLMEGNADKLALQGKTMSQQHFISKMLVEYLNILKHKKIFPQKLAFDINDNEVLVWAEVNDDNDEMEKQLILAEAQVNAKFHHQGFDMTSLIVENSDFLPIPNHYAEFKYKA